MAERPPVIAAEGLEVRYHGGPQPAVRGVSLAVGPGEGLLVAGPEGAGKTSLLRGLLGLVPATGRARLLGGPPWGPQARGRVGYGPAGERFADGLLVREAVAAAAALRRPPARAAVDDALERAGMWRVARYRAGRLDLEGARRLSLAMAIAGDPEVLVLDDPWPIPETLDEIARARARGAALLVAAAAPGGLGPALGRRITLQEGVVR